jgi:hypothetical protein
MTDAPLDLTPDDHVVLGNRIRACREVLMHVVVTAIPGTTPHVEARRSIAALDRLRTELDCHIRMNTPRERDPRRLAEKVYFGAAQFIGSIASHEERWDDDFACWELEEE